MIAAVARSLPQAEDQRKLMGKNMALQDLIPCLRVLFDFGIADGYF